MLDHGSSSKYNNGSSSKYNNRNYSSIQWLHGRKR